MICIFNLEEFIYGTYEGCIDLFSSHCCSFLCQNLYEVIPLLLWQLSESVWAPFHHKLVQDNFLYLILTLVVSHVNLLHIHVSTYAKVIVDAVYLISSA